MNKCLFLVFLTSITANGNQMRSIEHVKPTLTQAVQLEAGSLKLYFDEMPLVNYVPSTLASGRHEFYFPSVTIDKVVQKKLDQLLGNQKNSQYEIEILPINEPIKGIKVVLTFDDQNIKTTHTAFDAMDGRKGIIFHFFNKQLLNQLHKQGRPILHTACMQ